MTAARATGGRRPRAAGGGRRGLEGGRRAGGPRRLGRGGRCAFATPTTTARAATPTWTASSSPWRRCRRPLPARPASARRPRACTAWPGPTSLRRSPHRPMARVTGLDAHGRPAQRHVRGAPRRNRPHVGGRRRLRLRHQLLGRRAGRKDVPVPRGGRRLGRLGRRARHRVAGALVRAPRPGRPGRANRAVHGGPRALRLSTPAPGDGGDVLRTRSRATGWSSFPHWCSARPWTATPSPARSWTGRPTRWWRWRGRRSGGSA